MNIQTTSRKCQNSDSIFRRRMFDSVSLPFSSRIIITAIHISPIVMCSPWVPTRVKYEDRKPLLLQLLPCSTKLWNSLISRPRKAIPRQKVIKKYTSAFCFFLAWTDIVARPQVKLLVSRITVSIRTLCFLVLANRLFAGFLAAVCPRSYGRYKTP